MDKLCYGARRMVDTDRLDGNQIRLAVKRARAFEEAVAALCYAHFRRQGAGRALLAGRERIEEMAREQGLEVAAVGGELAKLLAMLQRGAADHADRALFIALALRGWSLERRDRHVADREEMHELFELADWYELATNYCVYPFFDPIFGDDASALWKVLADRLISRRCETPGDRASAALRLSALADSHSQGELKRIAERAHDPITRSLAAALVSGSGQESVNRPQRLIGSLGAIPRSGFVGFLRLVTGWAALCWVLRLLGYAVGYGGEAEAELVEGGMKIRTRRRLLGQTMREREETFAYAALASAARIIRYPALHLLVGALSFSVGIIVGGIWLFEGAFSGETILLVLASVLILAGGGLDLALNVLLPARRGHVSLDLRMLPGRAVRIVRVPLEDADRFLRELEGRMPHV